VVVLIIVNLVTLGAYLDVALRDLRPGAGRLDTLAAGNAVRGMKNCPVRKPWKRFLRFILVGVPVAFFLAIAPHAFGDHEQDLVLQSGQTLIKAGRVTFRFDTFGDEAFWGDALKLHQAIEGSAFPVEWEVA
jgi:hypothetical protein